METKKWKQKNGVLSGGVWMGIKNGGVSEGCRRVWLIVCVVPAFRPAKKYIILFRNLKKPKDT